jgi:hypothetical protein
MQIKSWRHDGAALPAAVEDQGEVVLIYRRGKPVTEWRGANDRTCSPDPLQNHPELRRFSIYPSRQ